jgi:hypothetical protein
MKRLFLALGAACLFTAFGPLPVVSAHMHWPWHHSKSSASTANANAASLNPAPKKSKTPKEKHQKGDQPQHLWASPKSVGWFHKSPGPMGAGSGQK